MVSRLPQQTNEATCFLWYIATIAYICNCVILNFVSYDFKSSCIVFRF